MTVLRVDIAEESLIHPLQSQFCLLQAGSLYNNPRLTNALCNIKLHMTESDYRVQLDDDDVDSTVQNCIFSMGFVTLWANCGLHTTDNDIVSSTVSMDEVKYVMISIKGLIGLIKTEMKRIFWMQDLRECYWMPAWIFNGIRTMTCSMWMEHPFLMPLLIFTCCALGDTAIFEVDWIIWRIWIWRPEGRNGVLS